MSGFRIGRKHAAHTYPVSRGVTASPGTEEVRHFSNNDIAITSSAVQYLSDTFANTVVAPSQIPIGYPATGKFTKARLSVNVTINNHISLVATSTVAVAVNGVAVPATDVVITGNATGVFSTGVTPILLPSPINQGDRVDVQVTFSNTEGGVIGLSGVVELLA